MTTINKLPESTLTKHQKRVFTAKHVLIDGEYVDVIAEVRHDDECGNGHNTFAITGDVYRSRRPYTDRNMIACGCVHDYIEKALPGLSPLIKWHLTSTDEPMHYIANTTYHARTCSHDGFKPGDAVKHKIILKFDGCPFTFEEPRKGFFDYLDSIGDFNNIEVETVAYDGSNSYDFSPNYSLTGYIKENEPKKWHKTPFKNRKDADEFLTALQNLDYGLVLVPTEFAKAVEPNLEAARASAVWPNASLDQLQDKNALAARLPALMAEFKRDVESLGLKY